MRYLLALLVPLQLAVPISAGADGKIVRETWDIAYLGDGKAGYVQTLATEVERDGKKIIHTSVKLRLTVKRFAETIQMAMETGSIETGDGKVTGVSMKQLLAKEQTLQIDGAVVGNQLQLTLNGKTPLKPAPWNPDVLGLFKQETFFKDRNLKPGDSITFQSFEPTINLVIKVNVTAKGYREVVLKGSREKRKLLLVEIVPEKVEYKSGPDKVMKIQLPVKLVWLDDNLEPVKTEVEVPGLGPLVIYRTTKEIALAPAPVAQLSDVGVKHLIKLKTRITNPYETSRAVYRITIRGDDEAGTAFSADDRQEIKKAKGHTFELHVKGLVKPGADTGKATEPGDEFTQSSYFINSDDAKVKELARRAVGRETDAWRKAQAIERWVNANMRVIQDDTFATADHAARTLEGDCTEFSMLTAAMCRAEGIPSRTAIGLIYADVKREPCFAFHMWTEVWIKGRWIPIDATLGKGYVGATHLKITDHSWHDERTMTPIFPVIRVVGRLSVEVLSTETR
jgi:hypothetical protein